MKKILWLALLLPFAAFANPYTNEYCDAFPADDICVGFNLDRGRLDALEAGSGPVTKKFVLRDTNNQIVGDYTFEAVDTFNLTTGAPSVGIAFAIIHDGYYYRFGWSPTEGVQSGLGDAIYYSGFNCTGTAYILPQRRTGVGGGDSPADGTGVIAGAYEGPSGTFYTVDFTVPPTRNATVTRFQYGNCQSASVNYYGSPAIALPFAFAEPLTLTIE